MYRYFPFPFHFFFFVFCSSGFFLGLLILLYVQGISFIFLFCLSPDGLGMVLGMQRL